MASRAKVRLPDGWMGKASRVWLAEQAAKRTRIVEVGVWKGRTTTVLTRATSGTVWAVDHWQGTPADPAQHERLYQDELAADEGETVYQGFLRALRKPIKRGQVIPIRLPSLEAAARLAQAVPQGFDMVFLDADHSYEGIRADIAAWAPLVVPGGILCGHDYQPNWPGVIQAVNEAFGDTVEIGPRSLWSVVR